jgi:hypothetical protein
MLVEVLGCQLVDLPWQDIPHPISTELALNLFSGEVAGQDMNDVAGNVLELVVGV